MTPELKAKIASKNKIVEFFQQGKLSEEEFQREMSKSMRGEIDSGDENWAEEHGARQDEEGNWEV